MAEQQNQNKNANAKEQDIHQLLKVRREKLSELQTEGRDPFQITKYDQTAHSADIKDHYAEYDGKEVSIATEPKELTEDWIRTLEIENTAPCIPAGRPT